jgi:mannosyltransferase OCH1-like enzyme
MIVNHTLLFDRELSFQLRRIVQGFCEVNSDFEYFRWREEDVLPIMTDRQKEVYQSYGSRILKADFARYIILYNKGGIYTDFDIVAKKPLSFLLKKYRNYDCVFLEEKTFSKDEAEHIVANEPIRKTLNTNDRIGPLLRIANYFMIASPKHPILKDAIDLCVQRSTLSPSRDYDVLFMTGPDVITTSVDRFSEKLNEVRTVIVPKSEADQYISHLAHGHWRNDKRNKKSTLKLFILRLLESFFHR